MFERFTDRARRVVILAQEEARMLNHNYVGTEHILLGLIHEGEGIAAKALEVLGITLVGVREQVEQIIGRGNEPPPGHIPFTPRAKKVLELSLREALQLGHDYIGTEHILLGLLREGQGVAAQVLVRLGADLNRVRQQVIQQIAQEGEARDTSPAASERAEGARPQRPAGREFWLTEIQSALAKIEDRLTAIERHLGMSDRPAVPDDSLGEKLGEEPGEKPGGPLGEKPGDSPGDEAADG
jgi:ATP-dependent Clp protease ATP-binding subunit ClpC